MLTPPRIVSAVCIRVLTPTLWQHCMVLTSVCTTVSLMPSHHALHRDPPKGLRCAQWDALPLSFFPGLIACSVNSGQNYASQCGDMSHLLATLIAPQAASSEKKDVPSKQQDFWNFSKSNFHKALGMSEKPMFTLHTPPQYLSHWLGTAHMEKQSPNCWVHSFIYYHLSVCMCTQTWA